MQENTTYRIAPIEDRWVIMSDQGARAFGPGNYSRLEDAVAALQGLARARGKEISVQYRPDGTVERVIIGRGLDEWQTLTLTLPPDAIDAVDEMARVLRVSRDEVVRRAITLLKAGFDASEAGNHLAIVSPDDEIVREIIGFRPAEPPAPAPAR